MYYNVMTRHLYRLGIMILISKSQKLVLSTQARFSLFISIASKFTLISFLKAPKHGVLQTT
jgi:hypothetical protein